MIDGARPDPDALLARVNAEAEGASRGKLKIFFGASAGVGKTYAMLAAARAAVASGRAVLVGVVETHGRADTEAMAGGLPRLPARVVEHRGRTSSEFDLDGALAFEAEQPNGVLLLDELAHSNAPGSRHPKRWQDVEELLAHGNDVWTTLNVQHLDSLNDIVGGITGVRVHETVPDRVFDDADEVVVVDLPPDELLLRLKQGKVYVPQQAERAANNFFRKGNLLALRELALRRTADRVDDEMRAFRRDGVSTGSGFGNAAGVAVWPNREAFLACIGRGGHGEKVIRSCARLAGQLDVPWHAVHVQTGRHAGTSDEADPQVLRLLKLARELGATTATLSAPEPGAALVRYARENNLVRLVMGRQVRTWRWPGRLSLAERVVAEADELDVLQVALPRTAPPVTVSAAASDTHRALYGTERWPAYAAAVAWCGAAALLAAPLGNVFEQSSLVLLFMLAVVLTAVRHGRGPAVLAAVLAVLMFNLFFVPPLFSLAVADERFLFTFAVMLVVGLLVGQLTAGLKAQARAATERERRVKSLYAMSRDLGSALLPEQVAEIAARFVKAEFGARAALWVADANDKLHPLPGATAEADAGVAQWAFDHNRPAGRSTDTLPANPSLMLPLKAPMRVRGVLAVQPAATAAARVWSPEEVQLLDTCAALLAISLERIHYIDVAQASTVQMEGERLRNSLLAAVSHDLRTPLAALIGLADTLARARPPLPAAQAEVATAIRESAQRMNALVVNLLDMARLQAGAVPLNLQWQPLEEAVGSALRACDGMLEGRAVMVNLAADLPLLHLDAVLMERVLVNLLENAAKYTPPGSPLTVRAANDEGGDKVRLIVEDRGPGITAGREEALFEKFERGRKESATPGVGLGLAICRAIVAAHGGTVFAENRPDPPGARFVVLLPRGTPPADVGVEKATTAVER